VTVIYEVNLCVAEPVADTFADWLPGHVEDMLTLPGFIDAVIAREETGDRKAPRGACATGCRSGNRWMITWPITPSACALRVSSASESTCRPSGASCGKPGN
jgi:hypothetical protein